MKGRKLLRRAINKQKEPKFKIDIGQSNFKQIKQEFKTHTHTLIIMM